MSRKEGVHTTPRPATVRAPGHARCDERNQYREWAGEPLFEADSRKDDWINLACHCRAAAAPGGVGGPRGASSRVPGEAKYMDWSPRVTILLCHISNSDPAEQANEWLGRILSRASHTAAPLLLPGQAGQAWPWPNHLCPNQTVGLFASQLPPNQPVGGCCRQELRLGTNPQPLVGAHCQPAWMAAQQCWHTG